MAYVLLVDFGEGLLLLLLLLLQGEHKVKFKTEVWNLDLSLTILSTGTTYMKDQLLTHLATSWLWLITSTKPNSCTFILKHLFQSVDRVDLVVQQPVLGVDVHGRLSESFKQYSVADLLFTLEKELEWHSSQPWT